MRRFRAYPAFYLPSLLITVFLILPELGSSQGDIRDSVIDIAVVGIGYAHQWPGGDMKERFGNNSAIGIKGQWKTHKNFLFGLEGSFLFGKNIRTDSLLWGLRTKKGKILTKNGKPANIALFERGFIINATVGKVFPLTGPNPNSGFILKGGAGIMQHHIRIDVQDNNVPQLKGDKKKAYDRRVSGFDLMEFIGYQRFSNNSIFNFYAGLEFHQGFTTTRRRYNVDARKRIDTDRLDLLWGIRVGWVLPIYDQEATGSYYF